MTMMVYNVFFPNLFTPILLTLTHTNTFKIDWINLKSDWTDLKSDSGS